MTLPSACPVALAAGGWGWPGSGAGGGGWGAFARGLGLPGQSVLPSGSPRASLGGLQAAPGKEATLPELRTRAPHRLSPATWGNSAPSQGQTGLPLSCQGWGVTDSLPSSLPWHMEPGHGCAVLRGPITASHLRLILKIKDTLIDFFPVFIE